MIDEDRTYTLDQALTYLGMRRTKFYDELKAGRIGAVKNGNRTFVPGSEIIRYRAELPTIGRPLDDDMAGPGS